jgi:hypothetical protein
VVQEQASTFPEREGRVGSPGQTCEFEPTATVPHTTSYQVVVAEPASGRGRVPSALFERQLHDLLPRLDSADDALGLSAGVGCAPRTYSAMAGTSRAPRARNPLRPAPHLRRASTETDPRAGRRSRAVYDAPISAISATTWSINSRTRSGTCRAVGNTTCTGTLTPQSGSSRTSRPERSRSQV